MCADGNVDCGWDGSCRSCGYRVLEGCGAKSIMNAMFVRVTTIRMIKAVEISDKMTAKVC